MDPDAALVCHEYGDAAILVDVLGADYSARWSLTQAIGAALRTRGLPGLVDVVASYQNVFVAFDPLITDHAAVRAVVLELAEHPAPSRISCHFVFPVVYGGAFGPDLDELANSLFMSVDELVDWHLSAVWTIRIVGSPLGAPMMDGPTLPSSVPRRASPRARVEPGSVALSGHQSMVYNAASPGGWQLIGRTPARLFDLAHPPHVVYQAGDTVAFERIGSDAWAQWEGRPLTREPTDGTGR